MQRHGLMLTQTAGGGACDMAGPRDQAIAIAARTVAPHGVGMMGGADVAD
jgi:hypothetical protein